MKKSILLSLLLIYISTTLVNSHLFISPILTSYFLFTIFSLVIITSAFIYLMIRREPVLITLSFPFVIFILWGLFVSTDTLISSGGNSRHWYLITFTLFYFILHFCLQNKVIQPNNLPIVIIIPAIFEAIFCICQYYSLFPSNNQYFKVTGTISNPNITAMFLAMAIAPVIDLAFKTSQGKASNNQNRLPQIINRNQSILYKILFLIITIALLMLRCRTALIGGGVASIIILSFKYGLIQRMVEKKNRIIAFVMMIFLLGITIPIALKAYKSKQESADGRLLVWKISTSMLVHKPLLGYGYGRFEREYNLNQAKYFESGKATKKEIENSDHVKMAFNELLENAVEKGIFGVLIFTGLLISLITIGFKKLNFKKDSSKKQTLNIKHQTSNSQNSILIAFAGICAFCVMSLVNFTVQAIPVMCIFIIYAAIISMRTGSKTEIKITGFKKLIFAMVFSIASVFFLINQLNYAKGHFKLKKSVDRYFEGNKYSITDLKNIEKYLKKSDSYYSQFGDVLMREGHTMEAISLYNKALFLTSNPKIYIRRAYCNLKMNNVEAALNDFEQAMQIQPSLFEPRFMLMQLSQKQSNEEYAALMAESILSLKPKVPSKQVNFYKQVAKRFLQEHNHPN